MPQSIQNLLEHTEDEADKFDTDNDTDEDSYSSDDSELSVPKKTSQQPGSSAAGLNAARTQPAPTKPVAAKSATTKAAASKFGFKAGFLTGILLFSYGCDAELRISRCVFPKHSSAPARRESSRSCIKQGEQYT